MEALKVIGQEKIGKFEFMGIEGGFGEGKKAMLVRDIALIHKTDIRTINQTINRNRKRFKEGIDLIDLKQSTVSDLFMKLGFTKTQWGNAKHIYLLSERGYAKLLKIMKDNSATRKANMLYKIAMATESSSSKENLLAKAAEVLTGEMTIPVMKQKEYSAKDIAEELNTTANMVGRIANNLGLKAKQPGHNKYGRWANSKSKYSDKEVPQWLYTDAGMKAVKKELEQ